ncbi:hypothetical protein PGB90_002664 [Kerria lacca]
MKIKDFHLLKIITCFFGLILPLQGCSFPKEWSGKWFQSGLQQSVVVNTSHIELKGICVEKDGTERFLIEDR